VPTLPTTAIRTEAGLNYVWTIEGGKLQRRNVTVGQRDEITGRIELRSELPPATQVLAARFDNLKEGAPAVLRAPPPAKSTAAG
jgi:multidrug efflux pump subunit AcrA (membrane-fusion protein)